MELQPLRFVSGRPLGSNCGYQVPAEGPGRPHRAPGPCRTPHHYGPRRSCHSHRPCGAQRSVSSSRLHHSALGPAARGGATHARQDEGSCSGGSYHTERSGYLADGPASDSSSGPCHGSSSDSVLNCTDVSLQGVYGSWSTFRSSLSSDYDPFVYYGPGPEAGAQRPRSLDSVVNKAGCEEQPQTVFSHVHYHRHRHHHYEDTEHREAPPRGSDEEQAPPSQPVDPKHSPCQCAKAEPPERPGSGSEEPGQSSGHSVVVSPLPLQLQPHCCQGLSHSLTPPPLGRVGACVLDGAAVRFHQSMDLQDDRSIHIHYGQGGGFCCSPPEIRSALLPVPLILDSGGLEDWPCCPGAHVVWQRRVSHSEPQLQGTVDRQPCHELGTETCLYCHTVTHNQGSEEESGV